MPIANAVVCGNGGGDQMKQYRVQLRTEHGQSKYIDVMANSHDQARVRAERSSNLLVLSTELIG